MMQLSVMIGLSQTLLISLDRRKHCTTLIFMHALTLAEAKFKLKTALGISEDFYQHCKAFPIYGAG
eukprot:209666-Ditylum_brightwellii.AAC.1